MTFRWHRCWHPRCLKAVNVRVPTRQPQNPCQAKCAVINRGVGRTRANTQTPRGRRAVWTPTPTRSVAESSPPAHTASPAGQLLLQASSYPKVKTDAFYPLQSLRWIFPLLNIKSWDPEWSQQLQLCCSYRWQGKQTFTGAEFNAAELRSDVDLNVSVLVLCVHYTTKTMRLTLMLGLKVKSCYAKLIKQYITVFKRFFFFKKREK